MWHTVTFQIKSAGKISYFHNFRNHDWSPEDWCTLWENKKENFLAADATDFTAEFQKWKKKVAPLCPLCFPLSMHGTMGGPNAGQAAKVRRSVSRGYAKPYQ